MIRRFATACEDTPPTSCQRGARSCDEIGRDETGGEDVMEDDNSSAWDYRCIFRCFNLICYIENIVLIGILIPLIHFGILKF